jgi:hypothetical protein
MLMVENDVDVNVWDVWEYETDGAMCGGWVLDAYGLKENQYGEPTTDSSDYRGRLWLRERDVEALGLTIEEPDFWFTASGLLEQEGAPRRVRRWLEDMMNGGVL